MEVEREVVCKSLLLGASMNLWYHLLSSLARFAFSESLTFLLLSAIDTGDKRKNTPELQKYRTSMHHPNCLYYIGGGAKIF